MHDAELSESLDAFRDAYLTMCRALVATDVRSADEVDLAWGLTPLPIGAFNRVVRIRLDDGADDRIRGMASRYEAAGVPGTWWVDPRSTPVDLGERLERLGFVSEEVPAMRIDAAAVPALELPANVTLSWATDRDELRAAMKVVSDGFGMPDVLGEGLAELMAPLARPDVPVRTVVARLDGKPVSSAQGVRLDGAIGIYNVATLPEARGRGIGAAVTLAVVQDAIARGARFAVLESSDMGHSVYRRIGFRDVASLRVYGPAGS
jgi:ribosomal protein S18 acetylase RimI-like enzyme